MAENIYQGPERRKFIRLDYIKPLAYKICKKETVDMLLDGYTVNVSEAGLLCNLQDKINPDDILWLRFDRDTLMVCQEIEKRSVIYQNGIIGKVVRSELREDGSCEVGVQFITREEKTVFPIRSAMQFLKDAHEGQTREP